MKKIALILFYIFLLTHSNKLAAGCGDPCIRAYQVSLSGDSIRIHPYNGDSLFIDDEHYACFKVLIDGCCLQVLGNYSIIWYKNNQPFDTTQMADMPLVPNGAGFSYEASLNIYSPGVYKVYYLFSDHSYFNAQHYDCGGVVVAEAHTDTDVAAGLPIIQNIDPNYIIFPNPTADGKFFINLAGDPGLHPVRIIDITGKEMLNTMVTGTELTEINLNGCKQGTYFISIESLHGIINRKVVIATSNQ